MTIPQVHSGGGDRTKILYVNPTPVPNKYVEMMRQRAHDVVITSRRADALAMLRGQSFDAVVMDVRKIRWTFELQAKAHESQRR